MQPFELPLLPPKVNLAPYLKLIVEVHESLVRYDESVRRLPNPLIIRRAFDTKEAVLSSRIEGTQVTFDEVLDLDVETPEAENSAKEKDYKEVINYRNAIDYSRQLLEHRPLAENEIKELHKILLDSSRGRNRSPGEFRRVQVFIGSAGATIEEATYVPPEPQNIPALFSNLVQYMQDDAQEDRLVQAAIMHYQFEAIHPFLDGNGRTGRLLIPIYLYEKGVTSYPDLYISEFLEEHRDEYYRRLNGISKNGDWNSWIEFFLRAVRAQTMISRQRVEQIENLHRDLHSDVSLFGSRYTAKFIDAIFSMPKFTAAKISDESGIDNIQTVYSLIDRFLQHNIIQTANPEKTRNRVYSFGKLLKIVGE